MARKEHQKGKSKQHVGTPGRPGFVQKNPKESTQPSVKPAHQKIERCMNGVQIAWIDSRALAGLPIPCETCQYCPNKNKRMTLAPVVSNPSLCTLPRKKKHWTLRLDESD